MPLTNWQKAQAAILADMGPEGTWYSKPHEALQACRIDGGYLLYVGLPQDAYDYPLFHTLYDEPIEADISIVEIVPDEGADWPMHSAARSRIIESQMIELISVLDEDEEEGLA